YQSFLSGYPDSYLRSTAERRLRELAGGSTPAAGVTSPAAAVPPAMSSRPVPAAPVAVPEPPAAAERVALPTTHTVRPGETVSGLCIRYYGNAGYWQTLAYHNQLADPARVAVGQQLAIPPARTLDGLTRAAADHYAHPRTAGETVPVAAVAVPETVPVVHAVAVAPSETEQLAALAQRLQAAIAAGGDPVAVEQAWLGLARLAVADGRQEEALRAYREAVQIRPGSDAWFSAMYQVATLELSVRHDVNAAKQALEQLLGALPASGREALRESALSLLATIAGAPERLGEQEMLSGPALPPDQHPVPPTLLVNVLEIAPVVRPVLAAPAAETAAIPVTAAPVPGAAAETPAMFAGFTAEDFQLPEVVEYIPAPGTAPAAGGQPATPAPIPVAVAPAPGMVSQPAPVPSPAPVTPPAAAATPADTVSPHHLRVQELLREALMYKGRGMFAEAEKLYREALALDAESPEVLNNLAYLYAELGARLAEAEELVRRAIRNDALREGYYRDTLGWVLFKKGDATQAYEELRRAAAYQDSAERYYHLGMVCCALRKFDEARRALTQARELAAGMPLLAEINRQLAALDAPAAS
ncbi:MAG TPA: tetratricopeptide repeat protein, partial [bacterium]|nr:tetratricopeptide repeat protein [bacterium]